MLTIQQLHTPFRTISGAKLRGVIDRKFFLFRLMKIYA